MKRAGLAAAAIALGAGLSGACDADHLRAMVSGSGGAGGAATGAGGAATGTGGAATGAGGAASAGTGGGTAPDPARTTVVLFLVDGLMYDAVQTAVAAGAENLGLVLAGGVRVETAHGTSPAAVIQLPDGSLPWGYASSGNVAVHTGCHLFESSQMDDIFLATRAAGITSVFTGGAVNYEVFTSPDFHYAALMDDDVTVALAIDRLRSDHVRLLRLHLQRIRDFWTGPADKTDPASPYIQHLLEIDRLLGDLIAALKETGVWDSTYLVIAADHGMNDDTVSAHPPSFASSWNPFIAFYGPDIKRGATIPYAELPDIAVTTMRFFRLPPLRGHLDPNVDIPVKGATGTVLTNLFVGAPAEVAHPRYVEACLALGTACTSEGDDFAPYRTAMLGLIR